MDELVTRRQELPDTIEDLARFVLVNEERVQALRAQIRAINKVNLAREVYEQKLQEAQEIAQITLEAGQKMGELLLRIQTAQGRRSDLGTSSTPLEEVKTKTEVTESMGLTRDQVSQYQQMALHPEAIKAAVQAAIERGDVVSKAEVMRQIAELKKENEALRVSPKGYGRVEQEVADLKRQISDAKAEIEKLRASKSVSDLELADAKRATQAAEEDYMKLQEKLRAKEKELAAVQAELGRDKMLHDAARDIQYFTNATHDYLRQYGGHVWSFEQIEHVPEVVKNDFIKAILSLDSFAQQLIANIEGGIK